MLDTIRAFMAQRQILEVETPVLTRYRLTDPAIESMAVTTSASTQGAVGSRDHTAFLQTSPEYAMKRILATEALPIYQICKVFRAGEIGPRHQPEFTMLEWYRPEYDQHRLMNECQALLHRLGIEKIARYSYQALFQDRLGLQPHTASLDDLHHHATAFGFPRESAGRHELLEVMAHHLLCDMAADTAYFIYDYPACMASLACLGKRQHGPVAERFEIFMDGMELANGCRELQGAAEVHSRFVEEQVKRHETGQTPGQEDRELLDALHHGLPKCAGVAWGLDRLLMVLTGQKDIAKVQCFPQLG